MHCKIDSVDRHSFAELPIAKKADFLDVEPSRRISSRFRLSDLYFESTSGSTGQPFTMFFDRADWVRRRIRFVRALFACSYYMGQSMMLLSSRRSSRLMKLARWHYVDLRCDATAMRTHYTALFPDVLYGPLSSLVLLAEQLSSIEYIPHRPRLIVSTAEQLTASRRQFLQQVFGCTVADFYGSTELGLVAWRSADAHRYRVAEHDFYFEFEPIPDQPGLEKLIVTDLHARAMPMIRFDTGDVVRRAVNAPHEIEEFVGREIDCIKLPSGQTLSPYELTSALEKITAVERYQVIQRADTTIDVYVLASQNESSVLTQARSIVAGLCKDELKVTAYRWQEQRLDPERKFRPVRSELKQENENTIIGL